MRSHPAANVLPDMPHNVGRIVARSPSEYKQKKTELDVFLARFTGRHRRSKWQTQGYAAARIGQVESRLDWATNAPASKVGGATAGRSIVDQFSDGGQQIGVALDPNALLLNPFKRVLVGVDDRQPRLGISFYRKIRPAG